MLLLVVLLVLLPSLNGFCSLRRVPTHTPGAPKAGASHTPGAPKAGASHTPGAPKAVASTDNDINEMNSMLKTEIKEIVTSFLAQIIEKNADIMSVVNPLTLGDNAYILAKNTLYEDVMEELLLNVVDTQQVQAIQRIDAILKGFIQTERKARSRLKLNYILAGASSNRLEEAIELLHESVEIDDHLLLYIDNLIKKELIKTVGPVATREEDEDSITGVGKTTIDVLRMIEKRLLAQVKMSDQFEVKLLAKVLNMNDEVQQEALLKSSLSTVATIESFSFFVLNGIEHLKEKSSMASYSINDEVIAKPTGKKSVELSASTIEKMKNIMVVIDQMQGSLRTGMKDPDDVFARAHDE